MASFEVGTLFSSYEELKAKIDEYQAQHSVQLFQRNSQTIETARKHYPNKYVNENLKYYMLKYTCTDCFKNRSWFRSIDVPFDIEMLIRFSVTKDGQHLEVKEIKEKHSHPVGKAKESAKAAMLPCIAPTTKREKRKHEEDLLESVLGKQTERWRRLKKCLNVYSDEGFAEILLNRLEEDLQKPTSGSGGEELLRLGEVKPGLPLKVSISKPVKQEHVKQSKNVTVSFSSTNSQSATMLKTGQQAENNKTMTINNVSKIISGSQLSAALPGNQLSITNTSNYARNIFHLENAVKIGNFGQANIGHPIYSYLPNRQPVVFVRSKAGTLDSDMSGKKSTNTT